MSYFPFSEQKILRFWQKRKIFEKLQKKNKGKPRWSFLDGPITANNPMGVHHAWGRTYKDLFQRYKAMDGFDQRFQNGFDCQGLWVEVEVEKELGFKSKKDIERFGIARFVRKCKERVKKYSAIQTRQSIQLGQWMDWAHSYYTMSDQNNYAIWSFLKKCWQRGLLYQGRDVVPWCWRCGTAISQHEILTEGYQEVVHPSVYLRFPLKDQRGLLVWTTTPWTLAANVAIAVHPDYDYLEVTKDKKEILILAKELLAVLGPGYQVIKQLKGKDLVGLAYQGPFDQLPANQSVKHRVIAWSGVSQTEGTGLVHIAPGCGQEDFQLAQKENLAVIDPVDQEGRYYQGFGWLSNKRVTQVNDLIFEHLKKKKMLFKVEPYQHRYPICWRCQTELIFRLVDEWYIAMDQLRKPLAALVKKIKWVPGFGLERELDWLRNMGDWLISKKRYWGLALPIFQCSCGHFEVIGGYEELKKRAVQGWKQFEGHSPHRPYIDRIKIRCPKCNLLVSRIADVGNPWLDAGIVPFSTLGYFSNKQYWQKWFPADLVCESFPGQFRNWFYAIIAMSGVLENRPPVKTIFGYALVVDQKGEEMHKSKGNMIGFEQGIKEMGVATMRWLYLRQNPAINLCFSFKAAQAARRKLAILWNVFVYYQTYVQKSLKDFDFKLKQIKKFSLLDQWIVSRFNRLIAKTRQSLDAYKPETAVLAIEDFFINDLSTWYIRRSRQRFQKPANQAEHQQAGQVLAYLLMGLSKLIAPMVPFLAEEIYQSLKKGSAHLPESVHLTDYPKANRELINQAIEKKMERVREIVALALAQRAKQGLKIRQPLASLTIPQSDLVKNKEWAELIKAEVNVKKVVAGQKLILDTRLSPWLRAEGLLRDLIRLIQQMRKDAGLRPGQKIYLRYSTQSPLLSHLFNNYLKEIQWQVSAQRLEARPKAKEVFLVEREISLAGQKLWLGIKKLKQ